MYDFAKEMYFDLKAPGKKSIRHRTLIKILKTPKLMVSASVVSRKFFYDLIQTNYVTDYNPYYNQNKLVNILIYILKKLLL